MNGKTDWKRWNWLVGIAGICTVVLYVFMVSDMFANDPKEEKAEPVVEEKADKVASAKAETKTEPAAAKPEIVTPTKDEILAKVALDSETGPFENEIFILEDNTSIRADMYFFNEGNGYVDGSAIFSEGKLASLKLLLADDSGIEEAFAQFGIYDVDNIKRQSQHAFAYEYTFNKAFARDNIRIYPFEMD